MEKLVVTFVVAAVIAQCIHAVSVVKRDAESGESKENDICSDASDSGLVILISNLASKLGHWPLAGRMIQNSFGYIKNIIHATENATNGFIGAMIGGAMPCKVSLPSQLVCTGIEKHGGFGSHLMGVVNQVPGIFLPGILKKVIGVVIKTIVDPAMDITFGGQLVYQD